MSSLSRTIRATSTDSKHWGWERYGHKQGTRPIPVKDTSFLLTPFKSISGWSWVAAMIVLENLGGRIYRVAQREELSTGRTHSEFSIKESSNAPSMEQRCSSTHITRSPRQAQHRQASVMLTYCVGRIPAQVKAWMSLCPKEAMHNVYVHCSCAITRPYSSKVSFDLTYIHNTYIRYTKHESHMSGSPSSVLQKIWS